MGEQQKMPSANVTIKYEQYEQYVQNNFYVKVNLDVLTLLQNGAAGAVDYVTEYAPSLRGHGELGVYTGDTCSPALFDTVQTDLSQGLTTSAEWLQYCGTLLAGIDWDFLHYPGNIAFVGVMSANCFVTLLCPKRYAAFVKTGVINDTLFKLTASAFLTVRIFCLLNGSHSRIGSCIANLLILLAPSCVQHGVGIEMAEVITCFFGTFEVVFIISCHFGPIQQICWCFVVPLLVVKQAVKLSRKFFTTVCDKTPAWAVLVMVVCTTFNACIETTDKHPLWGCVLALLRWFAQVANGVHVNITKQTADVKDNEKWDKDNKHLVTHIFCIVAIIHAVVWVMGQLAY